MYLDNTFANARSSQNTLVTNVSLKFFRQFDQKIKTGTYSKGSEINERLTDSIRNWAEETLLLLADHIPDDYVLSMVFDKVTWKPVGTWGNSHALGTALGIHDAYSGFIPPSWAYRSRFPNRSCNELANNHRLLWPSVESRFHLAFAVRWWHHGTSVD
ncbi:hypothetical protein BGW80DRAFT_1545556 [Lactifluus volemus]|nr:hypothetical protein BGW80DRAFT_1545556 [Lactifluus volemus]